MNSRFINNVIIAIFLLLLFACKKDIVKDPNDTNYDTDVEQFEAVWNGLNTSYVFWPIDTTEWDAIYEKYRPMFEIMENEQDSIWEKTWRELTSTLIDHHLSITLRRPSTNYNRYPCWI